MYIILNCLHCYGNSSLYAVHAALFGNSIYYSTKEPHLCVGLLYVTCRLDCFSPGVTRAVTWGSGHDITATHPTGCTLTYTVTPTPTPSPCTMYIYHYIDTHDLNVNTDNIKHVHRKYICHTQSDLLAEYTSTTGVIVQSLLQHPVHYRLGHVGCGTKLPIRKQRIETITLKEKHAIQL